MNERRKFDLRLKSRSEPFGDFYGYYFNQGDIAETGTIAIELLPGDIILSAEEFDDIVRLVGAVNGENYLRRYHEITAILEAAKKKASE